MALAKPGRDKATVVAGVVPKLALGKFDSTLMVVASLLHELRYVQSKCQNIYTCASLDANLVPDGFLAFLASLALERSGTNAQFTGRQYEYAGSPVVV
jgi:hypothetical protein